MLIWLLEPLSYPFMLRGMLAAVMVGIVCAVLGSYVVLRGMGFLGDALAHAILPGVSIAYLLDWPLSLGALFMGVATALGIGYLTKQGRLREDTSISIIFSGLFALGIVMLSSVGSYSVDLTHFLFGNVLGVTAGDLWLTAGLSIAVLALILLLYRQFLVLSFDPTLAVTFKWPVDLLRYLLLVMIAVVIVVSLQTVGVALMLSMLVTPAATAYLITRRLPSMMALAAGIGGTCGVIGLYLSYYLNVASGPAIVLTCTIVFILTFLLSPRRSLI